MKYEIKYLETLETIVQADNIEEAKQKTKEKYGDVDILEIKELK